MMITTYYNNYYGLIALNVSYTCKQTGVSDYLFKQDL